MGCAYVVLAHRNPAQLGRLTARLSPARAFVHLDSALDAAVVRGFEAAVAAGTTFVPRHRSGWASWGIVAAALQGMRAALACDGWSHLGLLSGQDYPLLPQAEIDAFLDEHPDTSFMARWPLPSRLWGPDGGMRRLRYRQLPFRGRRLILPVRRRLPAGIEPYGGSLYWVLTREAVADVLRFVETRPDVVQFYRRTWIPDEMFVPTAVLNSPSRAGVANESLTYIRWPSPGSPHPDLLGPADVPALLEATRGPSEVGGYARRKLFARKFDAERDPAVLDLLDGAATG